MPDSNASAIKESGGELINPRWTLQYLDPTTIQAGEYTVPGRIDSEAGREYAALNMVRQDLEFALACLKEAKKLGTPDSENITCKALIFSAVVAYARPFKTGVRAFKLDEGFFSSLGEVFNSELHNYLINTRDKHVAHSVNEFERCESTTVMVGSADQTTWRVAGIGFTALNIIGLTASIVERAIVQTSKMLALLTDTLDQKAKALYKAQCDLFAQNGKWETAPLVRWPSQANVSKPRR